MLPWQRQRVTHGTEPYCRRRGFRLWYFPLTETQLLRDNVNICLAKSCHGVCFFLFYSRCWIVESETPCTLRQHCMSGSLRAQRLCCRVKMASACPLNGRLIHLWLALAATFNKQSPAATVSGYPPSKHTDSYLSGHISASCRTRRRTAKTDSWRL